MTYKLYEHQVKQYTATCTNKQCPALRMTDNELDDWLTQYGRSRFWIDTPANTFSGVYDVYGQFDHGSYEYYNREKICCSLCNSSADSKCTGSMTYTTTTLADPFYNQPD